MKRIFSFAFAFVCCTGALTVFTACGGGGGNGGSSTASSTTGLAPSDITGNITLTPLNTGIHGIITLENTPGRVARFNSANGTNGAYTGNYTYTKVSPNVAEIRLTNLRYEGITSASDCHWTITAYISFSDKNHVVLSGTETLTGNPDPDENDPLTFEGGDNHFDVIHNQGGSRNFQYDYEFEMAGH